MALIIKDRVKEITTTTGTGAVSLGGASATFDAFQSVMSNGDTTFYAIVHTESGVDEWEVGVGTWNTGNTLTRTTVYAGSNGTSAVNFSSGNKDIFMTYPASKAAVAGEDVTFADVTATDITSTGTVTLSADPSSSLQAATKQYVDTIAAAGIHYHTPVRVEHPSNLNATYNNGSSGVGATLTNAGTNAALVLDNVNMALNDRVLVANQTDQTQNGVYTVTTVGDGSTAWVLTRSTDTDTAGPSDPDAFGKGDAFFIKEGDTNAGHLDVLTTTGTIVFGTTNIVFSEVAETSIYSAGTGLTLTGTTFSTNQDISTSASPTFNNITVTGTVDGRDVATDGSKLDGIEAGATADQTASEILTAIKTVDGSGSGLDADTLDGLQASSFLRSDTADTSSGAISFTGEAKFGPSYSDPDSGVLRDAKFGDNGIAVLGGIKTDTITITNDGAGSGIDADLLDGQQGSYYLNTGTTFSGDVSGTYNNIVVANDSHTHSNYLLNNANDTTSGVLTVTDGIITEFIDVATQGNRTIQALGTRNTIGSSGGYGDLHLQHFGGNLHMVHGGGTAYVDDNAVFHDGYHPNADKWTTARTLSLSGDASGSVSWDGSANATLSVTVADDSHNHTWDNIDGGSVNGWGGLRHSTSNGYIDFGPANTSWAHIYTDRANFYFNKELYVNNMRVFNTGYHPNADKWTTARTLSLSGDASGSVSWDGSANATLSVTVANDSHSHSNYIRSDANDTSTGHIAFGTGTLDPDSRTSFSGGFGNIADGGGWSARGVFVSGGTGKAAAMASGGGNVYFGTQDGTNTNSMATWLIVPQSTKVASFTNTPTVSGSTIWHAGNDGAGSGLDADTLDGYHASSFRVNSYGTDAYADSVYVDNWFRARYDTGLYFEDKGRGLRDVSSEGGSYGTVATYGGYNSWEGWSIGGRVCFMHDMSNAWGIYNDVDNEWMIYGNRNAETRMYYNNVSKIETTSYGAVVKGDGGETLTLQDTGDTHYTATAYLYFKDSAGTAMGYLGKSTYGSYDMTLHAASGGDIVLFTSGGLKYSNGSNEYNIWHAANDGSGSGLDADLLDGVQGSSFLRSDAHDTASGAITLSLDGTDVLNFSANSANDNRGIAFNGRTAISADYNDGWLRLNNAIEFTSGVYIPSGMWISGTLDVSSTIRHQGDNDTSISFGTDTITIAAGGHSEITVNTSGVRLGDTGNGYFQPVSGNYGSIQIDGGAHGGYEGYSIGARVVLMHNNASAAGIFNDVSNEWMVYTELDGYVSLYYNGAEKIRTTSTGVSVTGTVAATSYTGDGSSLTGISAGATGGGSDEIFWENGQNVTTNYTITNGKNAMSAGPITINSGVTVTIGAGEAWTIV